MYLLKTDASTFTHNRPITRIYCIFSWTFARSSEFGSLNTGRSVSCKLTVHAGGSSAGQRRPDFLTPSSSFNMGKKLLSLLYCNQCVNTSALTHAVPCQDQRVARRCQGGELRINSRALLKTPTSTWRTLGLKNAPLTHSADPRQGCQVGNNVLHQRLRTIIVWGKWSPSVFIL